MSQTHTGRHRSAGYSAMNELGVIAARTARPAVKASALAVASGSLVASFAVPASAAPVAASAFGGAPVAAPAVPAPAAAPVAIVPAAVPLVSAQAVSAAAVVAPKTGAVSSAISQGVLGFTAKKATAAATMTVERIQVEAPVSQRASRSAVRTSTGSGSTRSGSTSSSPRNDTPAPAPTGGIIGIAASLTGIPYVYGGTSRGGFDCSGYTQYVYRQAGKSIPRTAEAQRSASAKVSNPVPGDLIFFGFPAYHVGIYAGGGRLYHASRPGTVTSLASIWTYSSVSYGRF